MPHTPLYARPTTCAGADTSTNRRITIRYPGGADTEAAVGSARLSPFQKVRIHDISRQGVSLILPTLPPVDAPIFLQVTNSLLEFSYDLAAEVRHVRPHKQSSWLVGVEFDEPLSDSEFAALI